MGRQPGGGTGASSSRAGGRTASQPSPEARAVLDEIMRDPSKLHEIAARLQREDPALFRELLEFMQSQNQE